MHAPTPRGEHANTALGVATANPALKRELVASFKAGWIRPTYPEPPMPPAPHGYTVQGAPLW
jgi:hypothetical protein